MHFIKSGQRRTFRTGLALCIGLTLLTEGHSLCCQHTGKCNG